MKTKTQNKVMAKQAAITGLPTLDPNDEPTPAQRKKWYNDYAKAQDGALKLAEAFTTAWTNHGEPQEIDAGHFGVAPQTEAETLNAETRETDDDGKITREEWRALALTRYSTMEHYRTQRDELLAALMEVLPMVESLVLDGEPYFNEQEQARTAIANASK